MIIIFLRTPNMSKTNNNLTKQTIVFGAVTFILSYMCYKYIDLNVMLSIHNDNIFSNSINSIATSVSSLLSPKLWVLIGGVATLICIYNHFKSKKTSDALYTLSLTLIMTTIIATVVKVTLARYRPEMYIFNQEYGFHFFSMKKAFNSMPSGHTTLSFAGLLAIANLFNKKYITILLVIVACIVAISRVIILDHYISDVLVAAYIGIFTYLWSKSFVESRD
jgi:membrane-associated phospholipid phosphatase